MRFYRFLPALASTMVIAGCQSRDTAKEAGTQAGSPVSGKAGVTRAPFGALPDSDGKGGQAYAHRGAVALETQHYPDSPNHAAFPSTILRPGDTLRPRTVFTFGVAR
jgi:hypothetical protein